MRKLEVFAAFLMVVLCMSLITSCKKEDDDNYQNGKRLVKMDDSNPAVIFLYKSGKLIEVVDGKDNIYFTYNGKIVQIESSYYGKFILQLNNDGFVSSGTWTGDYDYDTFELNFEYSNGYLTKYTSNSSSYLPELKDLATTLNIKYDNNGNLLNTSTSFSDYEYGYNPNIRKYDYEYTFTSSNYPLKGKSYFFLGNCFGNQYSLWLLYYAGLLGKDPKNLISKAECNKSNNPAYSYNYDFCRNQTFDYDTFYDDEYVLKMTVTEDSYNWSGWDSILFFYE